MIYCAAVEKIEEKRKPDDFFGSPQAGQSNNRTFGGRDLRKCQFPNPLATFWQHSFIIQIVKSYLIQHESDSSFFVYPGIKPAIPSTVPITSLIVIPLIASITLSVINFFAIGDTSCSDLHSRITNSMILRIFAKFASTFYQEAESHGSFLQCQRPHRRGLHPRYQAKKAAAGLCSPIPGTVPAD